MFTNVLVPYDGSDHAQHAIQAAIRLAGGAEAATLTVLKVAPPMNFDDTTFEIAARMAGVPEIDERIIKATRDNYVTEGKKRVQEQIREFFESVPDNIDFHIEVRNGRPQEEIVAFANENDIDCIVMGRRGLGAIRSAMGSVSTAVLREVDIPVLVVK